MQHESTASVADGERSRMTLIDWLLFVTGAATGALVTMALVAAKIVRF